MTKIAAFILALLLMPQAAASDSHDLVIMDLKSYGAAMDGQEFAGRLYSQGAADKRSAPASTFKVALALMGFDSGLLAGAHQPLWPYRESYQETRAEARADIDPASWMALSVVWYSQKLTRALGQKAFDHYLAAFDYGNQDSSGDPGKNNGLTRCWLSSSLEISPSEQARFIGDMLLGRLPASARAVEETKAIMPVFEGPDGWTIYGKTGSGFQVNNGVKDPKKQIGWFVGWAVKGDKTLVFSSRKYLDNLPEGVWAGPLTRDDLLAQWQGLAPLPLAD